MTQIIGNNTSQKKLTRSAMTVTLVYCFSIVIGVGMIAVALASSSQAIANIMVPITIACSIGTLIFCVVQLFKKGRMGPIGTTLFCIMEGGMVGGFTWMMAGSDVKYIMTAVLATLAAVIASHLMYTTGLVKVNGRFLKIVFAATAAAAGFYLIAFIAGLLGFNMVPDGPAGILLSIVMIVIGCMNIIVDASSMDEAVEGGYPDDVKWMVAVSAITSVVWVYIEMLKLIGRLRN